MIDDEHNEGSDEENNAVRRKRRRGIHGEGRSALRDAALHAGKAFTAADTLWPDTALFKYIPDDVSDIDALEPQGSCEAEDQAIRLVKMLPETLRMHVHEKWFHERVLSFYSLSKHALLIDQSLPHVSKSSMKVHVLYVQPTFMVSPM